MCMPTIFFFKYIPTQYWLCWLLHWLWWINKKINKNHSTCQVLHRKFPRLNTIHFSQKPLWEWSLLAAPVKTQLYTGSTVCVHGLAMLYYVSVKPDRMDLPEKSSELLRSKTAGAWCVLVVNYDDRDEGTLNTSSGMFGVNIKNNCSQFIKIPQKSPYAVEAYCFGCRWDQHKVTWMLDIIWDCSNWQVIVLQRWL